VSRLLPLLTLVALVLTPAAHAASGGPVFGVRVVGSQTLGYFVYSVKPGGVHRGAIIVSNAGNRAGTVKLFAVDATTANRTGAVYPSGPRPRVAGAWVKLSRSSLTLAPGRHATVTLTVRVPSKAVAGQWLGGIVAETKQSSLGPKTTHKANVRIRVRNQTIVGVQVNVPGPPIIAFKIGAATTGGQRGFQQVIVHFANDGNQLMKPAGTVVISDSKGTIIETLPFKMETFLPQTAIDYPLLLTKALLPGDYHASVKLVVPATAGVAGETVVASPSFSVSKQDVTQVFTSSQPTQVPTSAAAAPTSARVSTTLTWALIAAGACGVLLLALLVFQLIRGRRARRRVGVTGGAAPARPVAVPALVPPIGPEPVALAPRAPTSAPTPGPSAVLSATRPAFPACDPSHAWDVAYDRGELGSDGIWRFPHKCATCGLDVLASDIGDANTQATAPRASSG
jgi:hypothetical protein